MEDISMCLAKFTRVIGFRTCFMVRELSHTQMALHIMGDGSMISSMDMEWKPGLTEPYTRVSFDEE